MLSCDSGWLITHDPYSFFHYSSANITGLCHFACMLSYESLTYSCSPFNLKTRTVWFKEYQESSHKKWNGIYRPQYNDMNAFSKFQLSRGIWDQDRVHLCNTVYSSVSLWTNEKFCKLNHELSALKFLLNIPHINLSHFIYHLTVKLQ